MTSQKQKLEVGCYVDGYHGIYADTIACNMASSLGWSSAPNQVWDETNLRYSVSEEDSSWACDEATDYLNSNVAEDGFSFVWDEGNLYYWKNEEE